MKRPYFAPQGPASPGELIVDMNAPVVEIKIILDNRYSPPKLSWTASHNIPAPVALECVLNVAQTLNRVIMQGVMQAQQPEKPPDLPPAPAS